MVGLGACTIFEDNIAYLNSFRIRTEYRNKVNLEMATKDYRRVRKS